MKCGSINNLAKELQSGLRQKKLTYCVYRCNKDWCFYTLTSEEVSSEKNKQIVLNNFTDIDKKAFLVNGREDIPFNDLSSIIFDLECLYNANEKYEKCVRCDREGIYECEMCSCTLCEYCFNDYTCECGYNNNEGGYDES